MRVAVVGSRRFTDEALVRKYVRALPADTTVVSGGCRGPDSWAEDEAKARGLATEIYPAKWDDLFAEPCHVRHRLDGSAFNALAGFNRNTLLANAADQVIAFVVPSRDGGAEDTVRKAVRRGIPVLLVFPDGREKQQTMTKVYDDF